MQLKDKIINFLLLLKKRSENITPVYGTYHLLWIVATGIIIFAIIINYKKVNEKTLKKMIFIYAVPSIILELLKQLAVSVHTSFFINLSFFEYDWGCFPFQFCTTPIYAAFICLFLKKGKVRNYLLSYIAFFTILGSIGTILWPNNFSGAPFMDFHMMFIHCGSLILAIYLLASKEVELKIDNVLNGYIIFLMFVLIAQVLNISIYNSGLLNRGVFEYKMNLFAISPFFVPEYTSFKFFYSFFPYYVYFPLYLLTIFMGGCLILFVSNKIKCLVKNSNKK